MKRDDIEIIKTYHNSTYSLLSEGMDYLNTSITDVYNWNLFEERYSYAKLHLNEKFEFNGENNLGNSQKELLYTITTPDNLVYHVKLNLYKNINKMMDASLLVSRSNNKKDNDLYRKLLDNIKNNQEKYQLYISFFDSEKNYKLTKSNKLSNESFVIFKSLENALNHFLYILNYKDDVSIVKFFVDVNEKKRIELYKRIINRFPELGFSNYLEDTLTDSRYILFTMF
jgi:hypothetical protein